MPTSGAFKKGDGRARKPKGVPNKLTTQLKDMILAALDKAGGVNYLQAQATANPGAFLTLVGKVLPLQVTGQDGAPLIEGPFTIVVQRLANSGNRT